MVATSLPPVARATVTASSYDRFVRVGLVGCVKTKIDRPAPAEDLYVSALFRGRRAFVEATCDRWFILSAKHGLVAPDDVLEPYEETLNGKSVASKRGWASGVLEQLRATIDISDTTFEIHAGAEYRAFGLVDGLRQHGAAVDVPAEHLGQGEQLAFYTRPPTVVPGMRPAASALRSAPSAPRGSYSPLAEHLRDHEDLDVLLSFAQIERILSRSLPASARRHRAWWANESKGTHSHAAAWMTVGWLVDAVDFNAGTVRFRRGRL